MREQIKYVNHINEVIEFGKAPYFANENDLRDFQYEYTDISVVGNFKRKTMSKTLPILLANATKEQRNQLYEILQKDIDVEIPGKLYIGDYYAECYIYGCVSEDNTNEFSQKKELKVLLLNGIWYTEQSFSYIRSEESDLEENDEYRSYPYGYPYGYGTKTGNRELLNEYGTNASFKYVIYGPCTNPTIIVGGNIYNVEVSLLESEYITITSVAKKKTIYKTNLLGEEENCFHLRNQEYHIFKKIPYGLNLVIWDGTFSFDIVLVDERSEPKWT